MGTRMLSRRTQRQDRHHKRLTKRLFTSGAFGILLLLAVAFVGNKYAEVQQSAANHVVEIGAVYRTIASVDELTRQSQLIVTGHVIGNSKTTLVAQPHGQVNVGQNTTPAGQLPADKAQLIKTQSTTKQASDYTPGIADSIPVTSYTFAVTRVMRGNAKTGANITVKQSGGLVLLPTFPGGPQLQRTFIFEHDPLMVKGQEQMLFLTLTSDGTYMTVGGPQGRFFVKNGSVQPVDPTVPLGRTLNVRSVDGLTTYVKTVR